MNILLVNPEIPDTYWSFRHAIKFIRKKAVSPPLGLITISAMFPRGWNKRLVDMNIERLRDRDILWADYVFVTAMSVQSESADSVIARVQHLGRRVVAGGPHFTGNPERYNHVDHMLLNEAELTFPRFLEGLESNWPMRVYRSEEFADMTTSPIPDYHLVKRKKYAQLTIQYSRGCPYDCEFCEITALLGRKVRTKSAAQVLLELEHIYKTGFRGNLFFVDDNFIGNKKKLKRELLPAIAGWNRLHGMPFSFTTEASIDLSDDPELRQMMAEAGFNKVFVGIESPDEESLNECNKRLNTGRNLVDSVKSIQSSGIEVSAGFIVGFDSDTPGIFQRQVDFIRESGIITAMVGILTAPSRTRLYRRLEREGRLLNASDGNNTSTTLNFVPRMDREKLIEGYRSILESIYSCREYTGRVRRFLLEYRPAVHSRPGVTLEKAWAFLRSVFLLGIYSRNRRHFWSLFLWSLFRRPEMVSMAVTYSIYGYHFRRVFGIEEGIGRV